MTQPPLLTDRSALRLHRARSQTQPVDFLHKEVAFELKERLSEVNKSFNAPLFVGAVPPVLHAIFPDAPVIEDLPELTIESGKQDLVVHAFGLHWADDLVGQLVQSRLALKPDGLFLGAMFGGATLEELRVCLAEAETQLCGGLSPRVLPMADLRDLGGLMQRAGFALPVADSLKWTVRYPDLSSLVRDLRGMGETNALATRHRAFMGRAFFERTEEIYRTVHTEDGLLSATFEIVVLTGWAPDANQPKPLRPGSATTRLSQALGVRETPLKD